MEGFNHRLTLDPELVCRTPALSPTDTITDKFDELKAMIKESSPTFYQIIRNLNKNDLKNCEDKITYTLWKYFNRARYRATPFGNFSGITILPPGANGPAVLSDHLTLHSFMDWQAIDVNLSKNDIPLKNIRELLLNATLYKVGNQYRYVFFDNGRYEIAMIPDFPELSLIVQFCRITRSLSAVTKQLSLQMHLDNISIKQLLTQLISLQVLIPDYTPNITGTDFFFRRPDFKSKGGEQGYIIAERKIVGGSYSTPFHKNLSELIYLLNDYLPRAVDHNLDAFIKEFKRRFELRFVPLAVALDPETGLGYANLESKVPDTNLSLLADRLSNRTVKQPMQIKYNPLLKFLLNRSMQDRVIKLEDFKTAEEVTPMLLPNTFSVLLHHCQSLGIIEHIGGATANALIGRFSLGIPEIENMGRRLAAIEQEANPDVLFFDVAYQAERHIDNVNRRKAFYNHELPILTWSCSNAPLYLDDILIGLHDHEIILFSKQYGKRMIPRIPSAYNYHRSDLPLFRFLCDLQHQNLRTKLNFKLWDLLPDLDYYPRVVYKNLVLSPESWRMPDELRKNLFEHRLDSKCLICAWLKEINLNVTFTVGNGDQMLTICPDAEDDLTNFSIYCRKNNNRPIYISETLASVDDIFCNESGKPLAVQLILNYTHAQKVYNGIDKNLRGIKYYADFAFFPPGSQWLYFAIYCHPNRFNDLLKNPIATLLKTHRKYISKWFFIRYQDTGPHLRLRILLKENQQAILLMKDLQLMLQTEINNGICADIQIKSYIPEIARYGKNRLDQVESFFSLDSSWALKLLRENYAADHLHRAALMSLSELISSGFPVIDEKLAFINFMAQTYSKEFRMGQEDFKLINRQIDQFDINLNNLSPIFASFTFTRLKSCFSKLMDNIIDHNDKYLLAADLLHMHINRLFPVEQRAQEAILYQHLFKLMKKLRFSSNPKESEALL